MDLVVRRHLGADTLHQFTRFPRPLCLVGEASQLGVQLSQRISEHPMVFDPFLQCN